MSLSLICPSWGNVPFTFFGKRDIMEEGRDAVRCAVAKKLKAQGWKVKIGEKERVQAATCHGHA